MPNIKPISVLKNYDEVLPDISVGDPIFLTENGVGRYAILDIREYERTQATIKLMNELNKGLQSALDGGWIDIEDVEKELGIVYDED